jgi:putative ABC transport system ATP-binding protein
MSVTILKARDLVKTYNTNGTQVEALCGVRLDLKQGELVAVMGPSGCGKSTLLHLLGGLDTPTGGEIHLHGERLDSLSESKRAVMRRKQIGFVFQAYNLIGNLDVADNIELPALVAGFTARQARKQRENLLADLGLSDKRRQVPAQLSGGQKQRVALARALINQPSILLADEPTGNLDSKTAFEVLKLLQTTHQAGQTILMVTHDPNVASIAQRVIFMKDGQISGESILQKHHDPKALLNEMLELEVGS